MGDSPAEWTDLPPELQRMVVERCDYITRTSLHATNYTMSFLADIAKLFIPSIRIKERYMGVNLEFTFRLWKDICVRFEEERTGGTRIVQAGKEDVMIERMEPADAAVDMLRRVCCKSNVTIGFFRIETMSNLDRNLENPMTLAIQKLMERMDNVPLKIQILHWNRTNGGSQQMFDAILKKCPPGRLEELKVYGKSNEAAVSLFPQHKEVVKKLKRLDVLGPLEATDEDILDLKIPKMHLESTEFTGGLVEKKLEELMNNAVKGTYMMIKKPEAGLALEKIPSGFEKIETRSKSVSTFAKVYPDGLKRVVLMTGPFGVYAEIEGMPPPNGPLESREKCLKRANCCCLEGRYWPGNDDGSDYDDIDDDEDVHDSYDYDYDQFEHHGGVWSDYEDDEYEDYEGGDDDY